MYLKLDSDRLIMIYRKCDLNTDSFHFHFLDIVLIHCLTYQNIPFYDQQGILGPIHPKEQKPLPGTPMGVIPWARLY